MDVVEPAMELDNIAQPDEKLPNFRSASGLSPGKLPSAGTRLRQHARAALALNPLPSEV